MRLSALALTTLFVAVVPAILASRDARAEGCVPGAQVSCPCLGGGQGVQVCSDKGDRFEPCQCVDKAPAPAAASARGAGDAASAPTSPSSGGSLHLATVESALAAPVPASEAPAASASPSPPPASIVPPPPLTGDTPPTRSQGAMNLGLGLTIAGGLAFSFGGLWLATQASSEFGEGCTNTNSGENACIAAGTTFGAGAVALGIGIPLLVVNASRPAPAAGTHAGPSWLPSAVMVGRSAVHVGWVF